MPAHTSAGGVHVSKHNFDLILHTSTKAVEINIYRDDEESSHKYAMFEYFKRKNMTTIGIREKTYYLSFNVD
jgi:hypothetical protein